MRCCVFLLSVLAFIDTSIKAVVTMDVIIDGMIKFKHNLNIEGSSSPTFDLVSSDANNNRYHEYASAASVDKNSNTLSPYIAKVTFEFNPNRKKKKKHSRDKHSSPMSVEAVYMKKTTSASDLQIVQNLLSKFGLPNVLDVPNFDRPDTSILKAHDNIGRAKGEESSEEFVRVTQPYKSPKEKDEESQKKLIRTKARFIKDDPKIKNLTFHVFKQALVVLDSLKSEANNANVKRKIDFIARNYKQEYENFVKETQKQTILSKIGTQKVILNTIDTSNTILKRYLNYLVVDMTKKGTMRSGYKNYISEKFEKEQDEEYAYTCQNFHICRSQNSYSKFLLDFLTILLSADDFRLKQSYDTLTEVIKNTDLSNVLDSDLREKFYNHLDRIDRMDADLLRTTTWMIRNVLANRNKPIVVAEGEENKGPVTATLGTTGLVDTLDEKIPATPANLKIWNGLKSDLQQYVENKRSEVRKIIDKFVHIIVNNMARMESKEHINNSNNIRVLLNYVSGHTLNSAQTEIQ